LQISNTVEKLPQQKPEELTERFVRGNTARTQKNGGAGIGLSAAKRIAEMHKGRIRITYPDEHSFCVTVELPSAAD
jgi:signal transduction histidine kinase